MRNVEHVCVHVAKSFEVHSGSHLKPQQHCSHTFAAPGPTQPRPGVFLAGDRDAMVKVAALEVAHVPPAASQPATWVARATATVKHLPGAATRTKCTDGHASAPFHLQPAK